MPLDVTEPEPPHLPEDRVPERAKISLDDVPLNNAVNLVYTAEKAGAKYV